MKFRKFGRATTATILSLGGAAAITACGGPSGTNNTVDYVYVTNSKQSPGQINVYYADAQSGGLKQIPDSPYPSGGGNPVGLVTAPNFKNLYVINNGLGSTDSNIVQFAIGTDAKLYPQHTYQPPQTLTQPNAIAINSAGTLLFVTYTYLPGFSTANPGPGGLVVFPIGADGSLGTAVANGVNSYFTLNTGTDVLSPTAINSATQGSASFVYVTSKNQTTGLGSLTAFSVGSDGSLTFVPCSATTSVCDPSGNGAFSAGTSPSAIASTPLGRYVYVTDSARNRLLGYTVQASGQIVPLQTGPASTDVLPDSVTVDPSGQYVFVANYTGNNVTAYSIDASTSASPGGLVPLKTYATGSGPTCVFVEPALGSYLYTTNFLDSTLSGYNLSSTTGDLTAIQNTPFLASGQPTCITATTHGKHPAITPAN
jgi:6-phosphogluconolactonase (cycloisomerase 2 family)